MKGWNLDIKSSLSTTMTGMRDKGHLSMYELDTRIIQTNTKFSTQTNHWQFKIHK